MNKGDEGMTERTLGKELFSERGFRVESQTKVGVFQP